MDGSLRAVAPSHPGAVVLHLGELEFSTSIVGHSPDLLFHLSVPALTLLALDNASETTDADVSTKSGVTFWKVRSTVSTNYEG